MPLHGDHAAKFGQRYEGRWTVQALLEVMQGKYDSIRLSPPGIEGDGIEFWLRSGDRSEHHQVKRQDSAEGRWTIGALGGKRVLSHFFNKLNDPNATCVFVSMQDAYQLRELAERAKQATSFDEFEQQYLNVQLGTDFDQLRMYWSGCSRQDAFERLSRVRVETISEGLLKTTLEWRIESLVENESSATVADILAQFALEEVGHELIAHDIWSHLKNRNCRSCDWGKDPHVLTAVGKANERYLITLKRETINGEMIPRHEARAAVEKLTSGIGVRSLLLAGDAGGGKSCVIAQIAADLRDQGWPILAFRVDRLDQTQLPNEVGQQMGLPRSPVQVLARIAQGRNCALIIDQVDAVSLASGRHPDFFECLDEMIQQALIHPQMHLVLGCRKFDIDNDDRLRRLAGKEYGTEVIQVGRLSSDTVRQVVNELGYDANRLNDHQLGLLSLPLHLKLLVGIISEGSADAVGFETVKDLYDQFWIKKQRLIDKRLGRSVPWKPIIDTLCEYLSDKQVLSAPAGILDGFDKKDLDAMVSEHVLTLENKRSAFFHEGFFDYAYARRFIATRQNLIDFLLSQEQHLFRRAQLRQILIHERESERDRYLADLKSLINHPKIRFHLKQVAFALLATFSDPIEEEWKIIAPLLDDPANPLSREVWILLNNSVAWFSRLDLIGVVESWITSADNDERVDEAVKLLSSVQRVLPDRTAVLMEGYFGISNRWNGRLRYLLHWSNPCASRRFFELLLQAIDKGLLDQAQSPVAYGSELWSISSSVPDNRLEWMPELIGRFYNRRLANLISSDGSSLSDSDIRLIFDDQEHDYRYFTESARGTPFKFIEHTLPFMNEIMRNTAVRKNGPPWSDRVWSNPSSGPNFNAKDAMLSAMLDALCALAKKCPKDFATIADELRRSEFETSHYLLTRAFAANGEEFADEAAEYICDRLALFKADSDRERWAMHLLLQEITPYCSDEHLSRLEKSILTYYARYEKTANGRRDWGYAQFILLKGIAPHGQSDRIRRRLEEWQRKFAGSMVEYQEKQEAEPIKSPIPPEATHKMQDEHWLLAVGKYNTGDRLDGFGDEDKVGGADTLAQLLEACVRKDPGRFARLALQFPDTTNSHYFDAVLRGIADADLEPLIIAELCDRCHQLPEHPHGRWICWVVEKQSNRPLPDSLLDLVAWYAVEDPDPEREPWQIDSGDGQIQSVGEIEAHAFNTTRGSAARTIAHLIFRDKNRLTRFLPALEKMVSDPSIAVRSMVVEALVAMLNCDRDRAVTLFLRLCETDDDLLQTRGIERFMYFGLQTHYEALAPVLERMFNSKLEKAAAAGARLASLTALGDEFAHSLVEKFLKRGEDCRLGAAQIFAANLCLAGDRAYCETVLKRLFDDPSEKVRAEAAKCL